MKKIAVLLIFLFSTQSFADAPKLWITHSASGIFESDKITNGKESITAGFFGGYNLESLVFDNPKALEYAKLSSQYNTSLKISFWSGWAVYCGFMIVTACTNNFNYLYGAFGSLIGGSFVAGYFQAQSRYYLFEAVNTYNGVAQIPVSKPTAFNEYRMNLLSFSF